MNRDWFFIHPHDLWMFRDSKPFQAGGRSVASSTFPPNPQVLYGIVRSHLLEMSDVSFSDFMQHRNVPQSLVSRIGLPPTRRNGQNADKVVWGDLQVTGPFMASDDGRQVTPLFPLPADLLVRQQAGSGNVMDTGRTASLLPAAGMSVVSNAPFEGWHPLVLNTDNADEYKNEMSWLDHDSMLDYLNGKPVSKVFQASDLYTIDERTGLAINEKTRTAQDGMLYSARFVRPHDTGDRQVGLMFAINSNYIDTPSGYMATGGEARFAHFRNIDGFQLPQQQTTGRVKVVLLTPGYFSGGWQPSDGDWSPWMGPDAQLVSVALHEPTLISGWDMASRRPKPMQRFVSAGSVYYFENAELTERTFTEDYDEIPAAVKGFGSIATASWDYIG